MTTDLALLSKEETGLSVYVPDSCVQGADIPFYVLWDSSKVTSVEIVIPTDLKLKALFNAAPKMVSLSTNQVIVRGFEVNGYLGGTVASDLEETASTEKTIVFKVQYENTSLIFERKVELFRCDIRILRSPSSINVRKKKGKLVLDKKLEIANIGKGTGIIRIKFLEDSELKESTPEGIAEFRKKVLSDLKLNFEVIGSKHHQYVGLLQELVELISDPPGFDEKALKSFKRITERLDEAVENDEKFASDFVSSIVTAIMKNLRVTTQIDSFLEYIKSIGDNKLILFNALNVVKTSTEPRKLSAEILVTDLVQNKYDTIHLPDITLQADGEYDVPIYMLLK